jgi:hypothetical protein
VGKKQPGDEWNAGGDAKQEGMFLLGYKTRFSLVSFLMYVCMHQQQGTFGKAIVNNTAYYRVVVSHKIYNAPSLI